jgi:subtilisin family serine protease
MSIQGLVRMAVVGFGLALCPPHVGAAAAGSPVPNRFVVDLKPGSDVQRVVQVLQSQRIRVVSAVDMPDGPAVWVEVDPTQPPNIDALRPLLPEVQAYAPDVPRQLLSSDAGFSDTVVDGETLTWGIQAVQAGQVSFGGPRKVCIIDTGYALGHPDLPTQRVSGMDRGAGPWDGGDGVALNPHGSHVAGTIAAIGGNQRGVVGVVPGGTLDLFIVRAFTADAFFIYAGDLVRAMQDCADAGANVISMSLGGSFASRAEERMVAKLNRQGILLVAAAGNSGNATFSYPASYKGVLSVAAVDSTLRHASFSQHNTRVQIAAPGVSVLSTVPIGSGAKPLLTVGSIVYAPGAMDGSPKTSASAPMADFGLGDTTNAAMAGKVCLIRRGTITFSDKVVNCESSGGVGAIIYNNVPGGFSGSLGGIPTTIPSVSASDADGARLKTQLAQLATVEVKPDDYASFDGTSMATPHVSAVAALVWSRFPGCTANHIRNALKQSARRLATSGVPDYATGYGLVQAKAALDYLAANGCAGTGAQFD